MDNTIPTGGDGRLYDVDEVRREAGRSVESGAVTEDCPLDLSRARMLLNDALASEILCVLRYRHHQIIAKGIDFPQVSAEFAEHAQTEHEHVMMIAQRIDQLGGDPDFNPRTVALRSATEYGSSGPLAELIKEALIAERVVIEIDRKQIAWFGVADPTTRRRLEKILEDEEEHANDLADLLAAVDPRVEPNHWRPIRPDERRTTTSCWPPADLIRSIGRILGTMRDYAFVTRWRIGAPIDKVFAEIEASEAWPSWWHGVRAVKTLEPGDDKGIGRVTRTTWRSRLPYDLTFNARTVKLIAPSEIEVEAFGELEGHGRWVAEPDGEGTKVTYYWNVVTNKWWMNVLAPIARPLFQWNHDAIMRWGGEGLARRLGASFSEL